MAGAGSGQGCWISNLSLEGPTVKLDPKENLNVKIRISLMSKRLLLKAMGTPFNILGIESVSRGNPVRGRQRCLGGPNLLP